LVDRRRGRGAGHKPARDGPREAAAQRVWPPPLGKLRDRRGIGLEVAAGRGGPDRRARAHDRVERERHALRVHGRGHGHSPKGLLLKRPRRPLYHHEASGTSTVAYSAYSAAGVEAPLIAASRHPVI
jgi:hypothetical protein